MKTKENWIEETLNSLDTIQSIAVPMSLSSSLKNYSKPKEIRLNAVQKWTIAASVIVLLGINLISVMQYSKKTENVTSNKNDNVIYKEYFSSDY